MAQFLGPLQYERLSNKWVRLTTDLCFEFTLKELMWDAPKALAEMCKSTGLTEDDALHAMAPRGFVTDLASTPKAFHGVLKPDGQWAPAAVIHDIVYQCLKEKLVPELMLIGADKLNVYHTRFLADKIFLKGMEVLEVSFFTRIAMYNAVRFFGSKSYGGKPVVSDYNVSSHVETFVYDKNYKVFRSTPVLATQVPKPTHEEEFEWFTVKYGNLKRAFLYHTDVSR